MASSNDVSSGIFRKRQPVKILRSELNLLVEMLRANDANLIKFGKAVAKHPMVLKQIIRAANSSLTGSAVEIIEQGDDGAHQVGGTILTDLHLFAFGAAPVVVEFGPAALQQVL